MVAYNKRHGKWKNAVSMYQFKLAPEENTQCIAGYFTKKVQRISCAECEKLIMEKLEETVREILLTIKLYFT